MIKNIFNSAIFIQSIFSISPIYADNLTITDLHQLTDSQRYKTDEINSFLLSKGLVEVTNADFDPKHQFPLSPDFKLRLFINVETGEWLMAEHSYNYTDIFHEDHIHVPEGFYTINAYGSYFEWVQDNHGKAKNTADLFNHGLCENIPNPMSFHTSTNLIFNGLNDLNDQGTMVMLFTGTGTPQEKISDGHLVVQFPNGFCYAPYELDNVEIIQAPSEVKQILPKLISQ